MTRRETLASLGAIAAVLPAHAAPRIKGLRGATYLVSDLERAKAFYAGTLGLAIVTSVNGEISFQVNERQFVHLRRGWDGKSDRFVALHFEAEIDSESLTDPDGHMLHCERPQVRVPLKSSNRISSWMTHAGITVADEARAMALYRDQLGFREIWRGGRDDKTINWINMRLPGATGDYIEFMLVSGAPTLTQLGSMHHICLHTDDIQKTWAELKHRGIPDDERYRPRIGRNGRWLLNTFDPDGTRVEFMEARLAR